ncbi:hypothetical protein M9H77_04510 [Catharanthus roseus]|uniref:Uncharacterized protein n=1 Tax=Catharanthus roseus TaxID=4058 RepID=A0ACC0CEI1_CATRO|nr:hypothetical protein M9H77_04510 [Catharanthus roseus]
MNEGEKYWAVVRLIGYCVEGSLFLVYEYIENGNLSQHLRGSGRDPLPWSTRVQIALDSARGLEYIHEHTVPVYIHRDIKSANILIDKSFHAKVADFGLTKLTEVGSSSLPTRLVGTFGYMPPEGLSSGNRFRKIFGILDYRGLSSGNRFILCRVFNKLFLGLLANERKGVGKRKDKQKHFATELHQMLFLYAPMFYSFMLCGRNSPIYMYVLEYLAVE